MNHAKALVLIAVLAVPVAAEPGSAGPSSGAAPDAAAPDAKAKLIAERERLEKQGVEFMTHYFEHPDPDAVPENVIALSSSGWMRDWRNYAALSGFLTPLFRAYPERASAWMDAWAKIPDEHFIAVETALWLSQIKGVQDVMTRQIPRVTEDWQTVIHGQLEEEPFDPMTVKDPEAYQLEMMWGWYYATGDEKCLARVLYFTGDVREEGNLAEAATTSLSYNAAKYPTVKAWCERELAKATSNPGSALPEAEQLEGILADADYTLANAKALRLSDFGFPRD